MKQDERFLRVRDRALSIMGHVYDPFHDDAHAREVEQTAILLYYNLSSSFKKQADMQRIRLLALLHDTSRKVIGVNFLLEPLMGGYISGKIGYSLMRESGYSHRESAYIRAILRNHESFLGLWKYPMDVNGKILSDADCIEAYSSKRLERALRYFEHRKFSNVLLNMYIAGLTVTHRYARPECFLDESRKLQLKYIEELRQCIREKKSVIESLLYRRVFTLFYSLDFLRPRRKIT